jgi:hypothetical protein
LAGLPMMRREEKIGGTDVYPAQAKACGYKNSRLNNYG